MRRFFTWFGRLLLLSLVVTVVGGYLYADRYYNNEALARRIASGFNKTHRGRLHIGSVHWKPSALLQLLKGGYDDVEVTDLRIYDSRGSLALYVPHAVGRIRLWDIILRGDFFLQSLQVQQGAVWLERYRRPDGPAADGAETELGLVGAFEKRRKSRASESPPEAGSDRQSFIHVDRFALSGITLHAALDPVRLDLEEVSLGGSLRYASSGAGRPASLHYDLRPRAPRGMLTYRGKQYGITGLRADPLAAPRRHPDRVTLVASLRIDEARLLVRGGLLGLGSAAGAQVALRVRAEAFGPVLAKLIEAPVREQGSVLRARITGPISDPRARVHARGLGMRAGRAALAGLQLDARYATGRMELTRATVNALGGQLAARGRLHLGSGRYRVSVTAHRLAPDPVLPPEARALRGKISGWLDAEGSLADLGQSFTRFRLAVDRAGRPGPLPQHLTVSGALHASADRLDIRRLAVRSPELQVHTRGRLWPRRQEMDLALSAEARRLRRLLLRLGKPPLVAAAELMGRLRGSFENPAFRGRGTAYHVASGGVRLRRVQSALTLRDGTLYARDLRSSIYGGQVRAEARVGLYRGRLGRPYRQIPLAARGRFIALDLEPATGGAVEALVYGGFRVAGTPGFLRGRLRARSRVLWAGRQWYRDARLRVRFAGPRIRIQEARVTREDGGHIAVSGAVSTAGQGRLDLTATAARLPLAVVPGLDGPRPPVRGTVFLPRLHVRGTLRAPLLEGTVRLVRTALRGVPAGSGEVTLSPEGQTTRLSGRLLPWAEVTGGRLDLGGRKAVSVRIRFRDVPLERFLPELRASEGDVTGRLSGTLEVEADAKAGLRRAHLRVDRLAVWLRRPEDPFGDRPAVTARLQNRGPLELTYANGQLRVDRFELTDAADRYRLRLTGQVTPEALALRLRGHIDLLPLEVLLATRLDRLRGVVGVNLEVRGPPRAPEVTGALYPAGVRVRPAGLSGDAVVRAGEIRVLPDALALRGVRLQVVDEELEISGRIPLAGFRPTRLDLAIRGDLSPDALNLLAADYVEQASGTPLRVRLRLVGPVQEPNLLGRVDLSAVRMGLRGAGKELALTSGRVTFSAGALTLTDIRGTLDGGPFALDGEVYLRGLALDGVNLHFVGESIPHRSGGSYEVEVSPDVTLTGQGPPETGWLLSGLVDVVEGRYIQKFDINPVKRILSPRRTYESSEPFWAGSPLLENLRLNLTVSSTGTMRVRNNVADIGLEGDLTVRGTLPHMVLGGTVSIKEGTFRIPFLRGRYSGATGIVSFDRGRALGRDEPYVRLVGTTTYTDRSDTDHEITLTVQGFLSHLVPTWESSTGLTSSQVLTLLATSRTPDDLRKGRGAGLPNLSPLIEDYIPLDLQLDLSSDSVQVYVERKLGRFFRVKGEGEFGYSGAQRQEGMLILRLTDSLSLQGRIQRRVQGEDVTEEADTLNGRVEARYRIRLRGNLKRALGF